MPVSKKYLGKYFILLDGSGFYGPWTGSEPSPEFKDSPKDDFDFYRGPDGATAFDSLSDALNKAMVLMEIYRIDILKCVDDRYFVDSDHLGQVCVFVPNQCSFWCPWGIDSLNDENINEIDDAQWFKYGHEAEKETETLKDERVLFARAARITDA